MEQIIKSLVLLTVLLISFGISGDFGWDEKYKKQFNELKENTDWGRSKLRSLTVERWSKEEVYTQVQKDVAKFAVENKEKVVSALRVEVGGNNCEAGPISYSPLWFVVLNNGEVHIFTNWLGSDFKVRYYKINERKEYWNIVRNLEQIKMKKAIEVSDDGGCTAVTAYFISYYDKTQSYQLIYKTMCSDDTKDKEYLAARKIIKDIDKLYEKAVK